MEDFNLDIFDKLDDFLAFEILIECLSEISIEVERLMNLTFESGLQEIANKYNEAVIKKKAIKDKLIEIYKR